MSQKQSVISLKVDDALLEALRGVPNRSEFIRDAILAALDSACPLCGGTGILTASQKEHWDQFTRNHRLTECHDCHEFHLTCALERSARATRKGV
jgi:metal-responsive CopG/Arc/MetJ family transcriptional regulator